MKYFLLTLSIAIILLSSNSLADVCTPDSGYVTCYENCYDGTWVTCAKIQASKIYDYDGYESGYGAYLDYAKIDVYCLGNGDDRLYKVEGCFGSWSDFWNYVDCDRYGCYNAQLLSDRTTYTIATVGTDYPLYTQYICWNLESYGEDWAWTTQAFGWIDGDCHYNFRVVECKDNNDCSGDYVCENGNCIEQCIPSENMDGVCYDCSDGETSECPQCTIPTGYTCMLWKGSTQSISSAMSDYEDKIYSIWFYDGCEWYIYTPDGNPSNDNLFTLRNNWCYYIDTNQEIQMGTVSGNLVLDFIGLLMRILGIG